MTNGRATCTATRWLSIVGIGEDGVDGLSPVAQRLIASAELVVGGKRHLGLAGGLIRGRRLAWPSPIAEAMPEIEKHRGRPVVVLAIGDPFHLQVGDMLLRSIPAAETLCLPQSSSFAGPPRGLAGRRRMGIGQPAWPLLEGIAPSAAGAHPGSVGMQSAAAGEAAGRAGYGRLVDHRARGWAARACSSRRGGRSISTRLRSTS
jgi:hypothetical protein